MLGKSDLVDNQRTEPLWVGFRPYGIAYGPNQVRFSFVTSEKVAILVTNRR